MHHVVVYIRDHDLAEIAAAGIRLSAGWTVEIVHDLEELPEALTRMSAYAVLTFAFQHNVALMLETRDVLKVAKAYSTPVVVLCPEPDICERFCSSDALPVCSEFAPLHLSALISNALSTRPLFSSADRLTN